MTHFATSADGTRIAFDRLGAGLALRAAASGLPITRLVLHEPPYGGDDEESKRSARELAETVRAAILDDRPADAIAAFLSAAGVPPDMVEALRDDSKMLAVAPTMPYDHEVMGDFEGDAVPEHLVRTIRVPTLVLAGGARPGFFHDAATRITRLLPNGGFSMLEGHDHGAPAEAVAPVVAEFLAAGSLAER